MSRRIYGQTIKRTIDFVVSLAGIVIVFPFCLVLVPLISASNKGPVLFVQKRPGLGGRLFRLMKFKTMSDRTDDKGCLLPDNKRLTRIGRFMRSLSIDELPQLINVIRGEMSLVGPRPLLPEYMPFYNKNQARRHEVRPGITGWAQVNGRNAISWEEKFDLDVWYVDNISFRLDIKILFMTLLKVLKREGISSGFAATMEKFNGSPNAE